MWRLGPFGAEKKVPNSLVHSRNGSVVAFFCLKSSLISFMDFFSDFTDPSDPFFFQMIFFLLKIRFFSLFITTIPSKTATRLPVPHFTEVSFGADSGGGSSVRDCCLFGFGKGEICWKKELIHSTCFQQVKGSEKKKEGKLWERFPSFFF